MCRCPVRAAHDSSPLWHRPRCPPERYFFTDPFRALIGQPTCLQTIARSAVALRAQEFERLVIWRHDQLDSIQSGQRLLDFREGVERKRRRYTVESVAVFEVGPHQVDDALCSGVLDQLHGRFRSVISRRFCAWRRIPRRQHRIAHAIDGEVILQPKPVLRAAQAMV